jgi:hypothetical protein
MCQPSTTTFNQMDALEMYGVAKTMLLSFIKAGISSKDGIVHGIAMSFAPTQLADVMVNKLGMVKSLPNPLLGDEFSFWLHAWLCFLVYSL